MSGFYRNTKQVSAGSTIEANVSPYGWTGAESQSISQIIDYVNQCKGYAEEAAYSAKLAKDSELVIFEYVNEAKMWAGRSQDAYEDARLEADRSEQYADQSVDIYNAFLNVAANQRIVETFQLTAGQTVIKFAKIFADAAYITLNGQRVDGSYLAKDADYTVTAVSQITLRRSYPEATILTATQDIKKDEDPAGGAGESFYVWNRNVVRPLVGVRYETYVSEGGRTLEPRVVHEGYHYLPTFDSSESVVFSGTPVKTENGTITIPTDKGERVFSRVIAEAVPRGEVENLKVVATGSTESRILQDRFGEMVSVKDFGAKGDGVTDDSTAFQAADRSQSTNVYVPEGVYSIGSYIPTKRYYGPGSLKITGDSIRKLDKVPQVANYNAPNTVVGVNTSELGSLNTLFGYNTGSNFGDGARQNCLVGHNLASGETIHPEENKPFTGRDNNGFGFHALKRNQTGNSNNAFGGDALNELRTGNHNCAFGQAAAQQITTQTDGSYFGSAAGLRADSGNGRAALFGRGAGRENRNTSDVAMFGWAAGQGTVIPPATFTGDGATTVFDHVGYVFKSVKDVRVDVDNVNILPARYTVNGVDGKVTLLDTPKAGSTVVLTSTAGSSDYNAMCGFGSRALMSLKTGSLSNAMGYGAAESAVTTNRSTVIGGLACQNSKTVTNSVILGADTLRSVESVTDTFAVNNNSGLAFMLGNMYGARNVGNRLSVDGAVRPAEDNTRTLGTSTNRWAAVYAVDGTIQTSDATLKTPPVELPDAVLDAWGEVSIVAFQWIHSVKAKGSDLARIHYGVMAQQVNEAFIRHGVDGLKLGLLCYDEWGEEVGITGEVTPAGSRWGIRPDECLWLEAAYQRRRCDRIEDRLTKLES